MRSDGLFLACGFDAKAVKKGFSHVMGNTDAARAHSEGAIFVVPGRGRCTRILSAGGVDACLIVPDSERNRIEKLDLGPLAAAFRQGEDPDVEGLGLERYLAIFLDRKACKGLVACDRINLLAQVYFTHGNGCLFLSDRLDALVEAIPSTRSGVRLQSIYDYLYFHFIPSPYTLYSDIHALVPEHWLRFDAERPVLERCNPLRYRPKPAEEAGSRKRRLLELLDASVAARLEHLPEETGTFLSGGLDSSTVTGLAARHRPDIRAYSIGFAQEGYDEVEYARLAAKHFGVTHHVYYVTPRDIVDLVPKLAKSLAQPYGNSSIVPAHHCARMAREHGDRALLAGDGGDELFGGNFRYAKQLLFERYFRMPEILRRGIEPACAYLGGKPLPAPLRKVVNYVNQARIPLPDRLETYNFIDRMGVGEIFDPAFLEQVDADSPLSQLRAFYEKASASDALNRMLDLDMKFTIRDNDLFKVDAACSMLDIDVEYPMLGRDVIDFSLTLEPEEKVKGMRLRHLFKESVRGFLPEEIIHKKKHGFGLPFGHWAVSDRVLAELVKDSLLDFSRRGIVRAQFIDTLIDRHLPEYPGYYGTFVWVILMLEQWLSVRRIQL